MGLIDLTDIAIRSSTTTPTSSFRRRLLDCDFAVVDGRVVVPALTIVDGDRAVYHDQEVVFDLAVRRQYGKVLDGATPQVVDAVAALSFEWWRRRLEQEWEATNRGLRWKPSDGSPTARTRLARYVLDHSRHGSSRCTRQWHCCDYCEHGLTVREATHYLKRCRPKLNVAVRPIAYPQHGTRLARPREGETPARTMLRLRHALNAFAAMNPNVRMQGAFIVPSMTSRSRDVDGHLHLHTILSADRYIPLRILRRIAEEFGLRLTWKDGDEQVQNAPDDHGRVLAYILQQATTDPDDLEVTGDGLPAELGVARRVFRWHPPTSRLRRYRSQIPNLVRRLEVAQAEGERAEEKRWSGG